MGWEAPSFHFSFKKKKCVDFDFFFFFICEGLRLNMLILVDTVSEILKK